MKHLLFDTKQKSYKVALLVKESAWREEEIRTHYIKPLEARGIAPSEVVAFSLAYNEHGKAPVKFIKEQLVGIEKAVSFLGISHLLVADTPYFKVISKLRKVEPHYGYVKPSIFTGVQCSPTINYQQLFYNPTLKDRLSLSLEGIARDLTGQQSLFHEDIFKDITYCESNEEVKAFLDKLLDYPALACDIETKGLHLKQSALISIAFAWNKTSGGAFSFNFFTGTYEERAELLIKFFEAYTGKLIFHNATFDTRGLIYQLFMQRDHAYMPGMLRGLEALYKNTDCTQTLAYLALNSTAGNKLSLKELAFEYTGNYALEEIHKIEQMETSKVLKYNIIDVLATWYVYDKYRDIVRDEHEAVYQEIFRPSLKTITQMELCGMPMDAKQINAADIQLTEIQQNHLATIHGMPLVKEFEAKLKLEAMLDANRKLKKLRKTVDDFADLEFNPNSNKQVRNLLYEELGLPVTRFTDTKLASTDAKAIEGLIQYVKYTYDL